MKKIAPNFVSVRLDEADKQNYAAVWEHMEKSIGIPLSMSAMYRLMLKALAEKHGVKGVR